MRKHLVPDLEGNLTALLTRLEDLLLLLRDPCNDDLGPFDSPLPAPIAGDHALHAVRRLHQTLAPTQNVSTRPGYGRLLAPDGRYEHLPVRLVQLDPHDVATAAAAVGLLTQPHPHHALADALDAVAMNIGAPAHIETGLGASRRAHLLSQLARALQLLELPPTEDVIALHHAISAAAAGRDVQLTEEQELAYQRIADQLNDTWALGSEIDRYLY